MNGRAPNGSGSAAASAAMTPPAASAATSRSASLLTPVKRPAHWSAHVGAGARTRDIARPRDKSAGGRPASGPPEALPPLPPLQSQPDLRPAPLEATDQAFAINLATALRLADARPLVVSAAQASAWVGEAQLQRAKVLWVPTFNMGGDYIRHDGPGPDFNLGINTAARPLDQNVNFLYSGIGFTQQVAVTDAIFEPLAARQVLNLETLGYSNREKRCPAGHGQRLFRRASVARAVCRARSTS